MSDDLQSSDDMVGMVVHGDAAEYKIVSAIGAGGMGSVYLGETEGTGRKVAVKFLHSELSADDSSSRERFEREMRVLQDLKAFRGIVQYEDGGQIDNGQMFLVMEFVAAPTLDKIISENPNGLPQIRAIQIMVEILSVLEPIHHRRFVHRDLKPHNICVYDEPLAVRLLDFGLSKPYMEGLGYEKVTRRMQGKGSEIPGSPHYMAVEQFLRPKEVDARTDLYACGIMLYELLAGIPPYRGIYLQDILQQHKESEPPPIESCADGGPVSYRLWAVVEKALKKKSESRYQSAAEFKEALYDVLNVLNKRQRPKKALDAKYRMIKKIGTGGNSEVFEVESSEDNERYALKVAREGASDWDEETLMNEADRALNHENIVRIFEFGTFDNRPALAMELLEGGSMEDVLEDHKESGLPENVFYRSMIDICRGLHHAHQKNIVHRDVKPGNMLRGADGRTKVCDFGIAKRFEQQGDEVTGAKNTTLAKGTAQYISPEQCDLQGRVDRRADVYCLGVMMYEMLAGKLPFTEGILIMQHLQSDPPPLLVQGEFRNPDELAKIVEKAMQKTPDRRYQSMKELAQDLVRVSKLEPQKKAHKAVTLDTVPEEWKTDPTRGAAFPDGMTEAMPIGKRGMSVKQVALLVVALLVVVVGGFGWYLSTRPSGDGGGGVVADDPAAELLADCQAKIDAGDFEGLKGTDLAALDEAEGGGEEQRRELRDRLLERLRVMLVEPIGDDASMRGRLATMNGAVDALEHVYDQAVAIPPARAFTAAAGEFLDASRSGPDAWREWNDGAATTFSNAMDALARSNESFSLDLWKELIGERRTAMRAGNVAYLAGALGSAGPEWSAEIEKRLATLLDGGDSASRNALHGAVRSWTTRQIGAAENIQSLATFLSRDARSAAGLAVDDTIAFERSYLDNTRTLLGANVAPADRKRAVAFALIESEIDEAFMAKLSRWIAAALGGRVEDWPARTAALKKDGLPLELYRRAFASALVSLADSEDFAAGLKSIEGIADDVARNARAGEHDRLRDGVLDAAGLVAGDASVEPLMNRWNELYLPFRRSPELAWKALEDEREELAKNPPPARTFEILDALAGFLREYPKLSGGELTLVRDLIDRQGVRFQRDAMPLCTLGLARRYKAHLSASAARNLEADARRSLEGSLVAETTPYSADYNAAGKLRHVNSLWLEETEPCISVSYPLTGAIKGLAAAGLVTIEGGEEAEVGVEGDNLVIKGAPKTIHDGGKLANGALRLRVPLVLRSKRMGIEGETVALELAGPAVDEYDFAAPTVRLDLGAAASGRTPVTVTVDDANPSATPPVLTINGRSVKLAGSAPTFTARVTLEELGALGGDDRVTVAVKDAFENEMTAAEASWTADVKAARTALAGGALDEVARVARAALNAASGLQSSNVRSATGALDAARNELDRLASFVTSIRTPAGRTVDAGINRASGWATQRKTKAELTALRGDLDGYFAALSKVAQLAGRNVQNDKGRVLAALDRLAEGGATPTDPTPVDPVPSGPDYSKYKRDVSAMGVNFVRLESGGKPLWIAQVEVSQSFAERYASRLIRDAKRMSRDKKAKSKFESGDALPLAPMRPSDAETLVRAINAKESSALQSAFGGAVSVKIPSEAEWMAAARKQCGGSGYSWGNGNPADYAYRKKNSRTAQWYDGLENVTADPKSGAFHFLSGNVAEIVKLSSRSYGLKGGSLQNASYSGQFSRLRVDSSAERLSSSKFTLFSGLRLAVVPRTR